MAGPVPPTPVDYCEVAIVGAGMCGVICAGRCADRGISYKMIDRQHTIGGVWLNLANQHSSLQVVTAASVARLLPRMHIRHLVSPTDQMHAIAVPRDHVQVEPRVPSGQGATGQDPRQQGAEVHAGICARLSNV